MAVAGLSILTYWLIFRALGRIRDTDTSPHGKKERCISITNDKSLALTKEGSSARNKFLKSHLSPYG
jgi:hypothetical protein